MFDISVLPQLIRHDSEYFHSGSPEEQERRQRQLVADNEVLLKPCWRECGTTLNAS